MHRIGRTARMGKDGIAYTFVTPDQGKELTAIEMFVNQIVDCERIDGFEAFRSRKRTTSTSRSGHHTSGRRHNPVTT